MVKKDSKEGFSWKKGSSTIEASYLIPFLVTIIMLFIYLSFFLYNRLLLSETAYIAALRGSQETEYEGAEECLKKAGNASEALLKGALIGVDSYERQVEVHGKKVSVTVRFVQKLPFERLIKPIIGKDELTFTVTKEATGQKPYQFIRECRRFAK